MKKRVMGMVLVICMTLCMFSGLTADAIEYIKITKSAQVVDSITYNGKTVNAIYAPYNSVSNYNNDTTYCCAAFVKRFYSTVYNVTPYNLSNTTSVPTVSGGSFSSTKSPQKGDIVRFNNTTHWAIVKSVSGSNITIIQQNAWYHSKTTAKVGEVISASSSNYTFFRYSGYKDDGGGTVTPDTPSDIGTNIYIYILNKPINKPIACVEGETNVVLDTDKWIARQRWFATRNSDGSYYFMNAANNKYLTVSGSNVQVGDSKTKWFIYNNGSSWLIQLAGSEKVLDLSNAGTTDGTNVQVYTKNDSDAQAFTYFICNPTAGKPAIKKSADYIKESGLVTISWDKTDYTKEYKYYLAEYPVGFAYSTNTKSGSTQNNSITFNNLTSGQYTCFIHAVSHKGEEGSQSNWVTFKVYADDYIPTKTVVSNNHIYALYDYETSWSFARDLCKELGGNLVTVTSAEENTVITDLIQSGTKDAYWLGATDIDGTDKDFVWVTGEPFSYSNWMKGEPSSGGTDGEKEHFIEVRKSYGNKWNDVNNISKKNKGFILEIDTDEYSPTAEQTYNGNQYLLFDKNTAWTEADVFCKALGGHLLYTNNEEEQAFIKDFIKNGQRDWYYIGGQKRNGVWEWEDGSGADFVNWSASADSWTGTNLMMYKSGTCVGLRNVYYPESNLNRMGFICEIESNTPILNPTPKPTAAPTPKPTPAHGDQQEGFIVSGTDVINNSDTEQTATIIVAEYTDNELKNVTSTKETFSAGQTKTFTVPNGGKLFVWDSLEGMKPLTK